MNGEEIRRAREAKGWTQEQLATALGVGHRTVGNWERGATIPKNRAGKLQKVLGDELLADSDPLRSASDLAILTELMRRAVARG